MDDAEFYKQLLALDSGLAKRWKKAAYGKLATTIDQIEAMMIFNELFHSKKITADQAKAIAFMWTWMKSKMTRPAQAMLLEKLEEAYADDYFFAGSSAQLVGPDKLKVVTGAIGASAGKLDFTSPGTGVSYSADHYLAIKQLVDNGQITVFEVDAAQILDKLGVYASDSDRLVVYKGWPASRLAGTVVHEATHAVQDWLDIVSTHNFTEADAYIAGAAADLGVNVATYTANEKYPAQRDAAELVLARKAVATNAAWDKAYKAVVTAVESDPMYPDAKTLPWKPLPVEKGKDEKKTLLDIMKKIKTAKP